MSDPSSGEARAWARWRVPLLAYLVTRLALLTAVRISLSWRPVRDLPGLWRAFPDQLWIDGWARWDSGWYWSIAAKGWAAPGSANANFFPLFSWAASAVSAPFRPFMGDPEQAFYIGGLVVANGALIAALVGVYRLASALTDERTAARATWLMAIFPFSFFFGAVYADSLYLALVVWAFWAAHRRRWGVACLLVMFAGATRSIGFVAIAALGLEYLRQHGWRPWRIRWNALWFLISPLGVGGLLAWCWWTSGDALLPYHTQMVEHGRVVSLMHIANGFEHVREAQGFERATWIWYLGLLPVMVALAIQAWRRFGAGHGVFVLASVAMPILVGLDGTGRYVSVLFPAFMGAALLLRNRLAFAAVCVGSVPFLVWFAEGFAHWDQIN